ncbi:hypothetical protein NDU88_008219 [Pleurodeles waltl]|uniref:Cyclin-Q n=1 Tax=Pleurodeles waltl TaxID=8319 RepID=A0AAV7RRP3_PLEWA|nr:hypothetical protein NDU88_008219 [Pleurodeles waltl]
MQSIPVATACTIYKFFCETSLDPYDPCLVDMSAIYLAGKVEEQHLRTRDIINVTHRHLNPGSEPLEMDAHFWEMRDSVVQCELLTLRLLNFRVSFQNPHKYLLHYLVSLKNWMKRHCWDRTPIAQAAWALLRDRSPGLMSSIRGTAHCGGRPVLCHTVLRCGGASRCGDREAVVAGF